MFGVFGLPLIAALRVVLRTVNVRMQGPERVFVVAPLEDARMLQRKLANHPEYEMALVGAVGDGSEELGLPVAAEVDEVESLIYAGEVDLLVARLRAEYVEQDQMHQLMRACHRAGVRFGCFPAVKGLLLPGTEIHHIEAMGVPAPPILPFSPAARR